MGTGQVTVEQGDKGDVNLFIINLFGWRPVFILLEVSTSTTVLCINNFLKFCLKSMLLKNMSNICIVCCVLVVVFTSFATSTDGCKGCLNLDQYNFDKVIPKFETVLVKFDVSYPYGDKHEVFNELALEIADTPNLILGQVAIKDYGEKENQEFSKKYGVHSKDDLPALRLFVQGEDDPFVYEKNMPWTNENLKKFLREHTGIYLGLPGCIEKFDKLARTFITSSSREKVLKETENEVGKLKSQKDKDTAKTYIKVMKKVLESGPTFVTQENSRLGKILEGKLNDKKRRELTNRQNVLGSFIIEPPKSEL